MQMSTGIRITTLQAAAEMSHHVVNEFKTALDSGFDAVDSGLYILVFGFLCSETHIPDSNR